MFWLGQVVQLDERYMREIESRYGEIRKATLVLWGEQDAWLAPGLGRRLAEAIPGAHGVWVTNVGHFLPKTSPDAWPKRWLSSSQPERPESPLADRPIDHHVAGPKAEHPNKPGRPRNDRNHTTPQPPATTT
jgi:hypothetical protein